MAELRSTREDTALAALRRGGEWLQANGFAARRALLEECIASVALSTEDWCGAACAIKGIDPASDLAAEELALGPAVVLRQLRLLHRGHADLARGRPPSLPGPARRRPDGTWHVPVFPCRGLADRILFPGYRATTIAAPGELQRMPPSAAGIALVLGAGNVTAIPISDALTAICNASRPVLLKLHPLHEPLAPIFEKALAPLIAQDLLRIVTVDTERAAQMVADPRIAAVHLTGSAVTFAHVVEAARDTQKVLTCELGNVSPVIVAPGDYSKGDLRFHAANVATMIANNASFNCLAAQVVITARAWPQRRAFLVALHEALDALPPREAFYPGAAERYRAFTGRAPATTALPWALLEDVDPDLAPHLFTDECFVAACAETALDAATPDEFCAAAATFANERLAGDLGATVIAPRAVRKTPAFARMLDALRYGTIGVNHWAALSFALAAPPWGAYDATRNTPDDPRSGIGYAHDTYLLRAPLKTIVEGPFRPWPRPAWFADRRNARAILSALCAFYARPSAPRLLAVLGHALR